MKSSLGSSRSNTSIKEEQSFDLYTASFSRALKIRKEDIGPIVLAVVVVAICLTTCLISYFVVLSEQEANAAAVLASIQLSTINNVQIALTSSFAYIQSIGNFFQYSAGEVNYTSQFIPLLYAQGFPMILSGMYYGERVLDKNKAYFTQKMRAKGGIYTNFTIHKEYVPPGVNLNYFQPYDAAEYYPIIMSVSSVPNYTGAFIGWDWYQVSENVQALNILNDTLQPSMTQATVIPFSPTPQGPQLIVFETVVIMVPVIDIATNTLKGFIAGSIYLNNIISDATNSSILTDIFYAIYDTNATEDGNGGLIYSSNQYYNNSDVSAILNSAPFRTVQTFQYVNRIYSTVFAPTPNFISNNSSFLKYVGIIISIIVCLILLGGCLVLFFVNRLRKSIIQRQQSRKHFESLKETYERTQELLNRLANQEAKTRSTLDSIPQFVVILNRAGRILQTNKTFDKLFGFSEAQLQKGLYIGTLFTKLDSGFFNDAKYVSTEEETVFLHILATSNEGHEVQVSTVLKTLNSLAEKKVDSLLASHMISPNEVEMNEEEEAFTLIGEPISKIEDKIILNLLNK